MATFEENVEQQLRAQDGMTRVPAPIMPSASCVDAGSLLNLSRLQFLHVLASITALALFRRIKIMCVNMLSPGPNILSKYSINKNNYYTSAWKEKYQNIIPSNTLEVCKPKI